MTVSDIDPNKRAGELPTDEVNKTAIVLNNPLRFKIPMYMINRNRSAYDITTVHDVMDSESFNNVVISTSMSPTVSTSFSLITGTLRHPRRSCPQLKRRSSRIL